MGPIILSGLILPEAEGELRLRYWASTDDPCVVSAARDSLISLDPQIPSECHERQAVAWIERQNKKIIDGHAIPLCISLNSTNEAVGMIGVFGLDAAGAPSARCGYWVVRHMRGRGFAAKSLVVLTAWTFRNVSKERLELLVDPKNLASRRTAEIAGYVLETVSMTSVEVGGGIRDMLTFTRRRGDMARRESDDVLVQHDTCVNPTD
jgi:[ribosomal protein S5]-alanine N-acetyltransferase